MAGVSFQLDTGDLLDVVARLEHAGRAEFLELAEGLGALGVAQTQRRIQEEKTSPAGAAWAPTSDGRGALFVTGSHLSDSISYAASGTAVQWGSGWIGAGVHQFGATIVPKNAKALRFVAGGRTVFAQSVTIPARPYLGLSADNAEEMRDTAALFLERYVQ